jgi:hypothetical protein
MESSLRHRIAAQISQLDQPNRLNILRDQKKSDRLNKKTQPVPKTSQNYRYDEPSDESPLVASTTNPSRKKSTSKKPMIRLDDIQGNYKSNRIKPKILATKFSEEAPPNVRNITPIAQAQPTQFGVSENFETLDGSSAKGKKPTQFGVNENFETVEGSSAKGKTPKQIEAKILSVLKEQNCYSSNYDLSIMHSNNFESFGCSDSCSKISQERSNLGSGFNSSQKNQRVLLSKENPETEECERLAAYVLVNYPQEMSFRF